MSNKQIDKTGKQVTVWEPLVRLFHWSLVLFFIIAYITGEEEGQLHIYTGYAVLGLVVWRILWGFVGSKHTRFRDFIRSPKTVVTYITSLATGKPKHYLGHNPAGGYMIVLLLVMLLVTTVTGLKVYGVEGHGPLASGNEITLISTAIADNDEHKYEKNEHNNHIDEEAEEFWEEIHEVASNLTVLLILIHVLGVIVAGRLHHENLVRAMITGKKKEG